MKTLRKRKLLPVLLSLMMVVMMVTPAITASALTLGSTLDTFTVLAGSTVTNTGPTTITGNVGVSPGTAITGFPPGIISSGTQHSADALALQAQSELTTAYNTAAGLIPTSTLTGMDLGGMTLTAGVYFFATSAQLTGTLTLDGSGDPNATFIFQIGSTLTTAASSTVSLINNASAANVFWQVGSSATIGTTTTFKGNILALTSISANTSATFEGKLLARNGAVTLDTNNIYAPAAPSPTPTPTVTVTPTPTVTVTPTPTITVPPTDTPTPTVTVTPTITIPPTDTPTPTVTPTATPTATPTVTPTETPTVVASDTPGPTITPTPTGDILPVTALPDTSVKYYIMFIAGIAFILVGIAGLIYRKQKENQ